MVVDVAVLERLSFYLWIVMPECVESKGRVPKNEKYGTYFTIPGGRGQ